MKGRMAFDQKLTGLRESRFIPTGMMNTMLRTMNTMLRTMNAIFS